MRDLKIMGEEWLKISKYRRLWSLLLEKAMREERKNKKQKQRMETENKANLTRDDSDAKRRTTYIIMPCYSSSVITNNSVYITHLVASRGYYGPTRITPCSAIIICSL